MKCQLVYKDNLLSLKLISNLQLKVICMLNKITQIPNKSTILLTFRLELPFPSLTFTMIE